MKRRDFLATSIAASAAVCSSYPRRGNAQRQPQPLRQVEAWTSDDIFLQGVNAPVFREWEIQDLEVTGTIPVALGGTYIRNGPNPMFEPIAYHYPLEGDGMLHAISFKEGKAQYRNRWILTKGLVYEMAAGQALPELRFRNYANTNIINHAGNLLALYEIGLPYRITSDLETIGEWDFQGGIEQAMTAHPRFDVQTNELHFYRYSLFTEPYLTYYVADAQGNIIRTVPIELPQPALLHDMSLTKNYAIFFHCPLVFDWQQASQGGTPFVWRPQQGTRICLIHRHDYQQEPIWIEAESFWIWHFMNAFEDGKRINVDAAFYPEMKLESTLDAILANRSNFQRIVLDPDEKTIAHYPLDDRVVDFPTIDCRQSGKPYRFGYMPHMDLSVIAQIGIPNSFPELIQYDVINQTSRVHRFRAGCYGGEAIVVPTGDTAESDHYVMTWVFDAHRQASDLVILDAANFEGEPIAQVHLPVRVPFGLHGNWFPQL